MIRTITRPPGQDRVILNTRIIDATIADIRNDMRALCILTEGQEQFFDFLVGKAPKPPSIKLVSLAQQLEVIDRFLDVIDGFPNARTFEQTRFPAFGIAENMRSKPKHPNTPQYAIGPKRRRYKGRRGNPSSSR